MRHYAKSGVVDEIERVSEPKTFSDRFSFTLFLGLPQWSYSKRTTESDERFFVFSFGFSSWIEHVQFDSLRTDRWLTYQIGSVTFKLLVPVIKLEDLLVLFHI